MVSTPPIRPVDWIPASSVLAHEERDFTVWLADNLELLGEALGLDEITLVERESRVESFRADILAVADDGSEDGLPVVVENQYGRTDHGHLGKLITYLAAQQRGLGVWIVEEATQAHSAAVDFLNRTSGESVGYALVIVRFAPAPEQSHYVDFDVVAEPNLWLKTATTPTTRRGGHPDRQAFLSAVTELVEEPLVQAGWDRVRLREDRWHVRLWLPRTHPLGGRPSYVTLRAKGDEFAFRHIVRAGSLEQSWQVIDLLRDQSAERLAQELPAEAEVVWHAGESRANAANDQVKIVHTGGGYNDLDPAEAAQWAIAVGTTWLRTLSEEPPAELHTLIRPPA